MIIVHVSGFTDEQWDQYIRRRQLIDRWSSSTIQEEPKLKSFKQVNNNLPELDSYNGILPQDYWDKWEKKTYEELTPAMSWVNPDKLWAVASRLKYKDKQGRLQRAMVNLSRGALIGCKGPSRLPTSHPNSQSAADYGVRVADSLQTWIKEGLCFGPLRPEEMPWDDYTTNSITVKLKPNGKARICINMSAPYKRPSDPEGAPASVNSGIDSDEFPTSMSSTQSFCTSLMRSGTPSKFCKLDWVSAYKHVAVNKSDHKLQCFQFGGRLFGELMLTFGCSSSAGLYDDLAKLIMELATIAAKADDRLINQILDDVVGCSHKGDSMVEQFYDAYRAISEEVGVSLADEADPDKAFRAASIRKVFGISYDLERWVWYISDDKLIPLLISLSDVKENSKIGNGHMMSLNGKLNHYMWLVPGGPWQRGFLLRLQDSTKPTGFMFDVTETVKKQAAWWITNLKAAREESKILDPRPMSSLTPISVFTDAAGGDAGKIKNGIGGFAPPGDWCYMPWPKLIRENRGNTDGVKFAHKLCTLEGFAALCGLVSIPERARNKEVVIHCDNAAFVAVYRKHHSKCQYAYTVAKALYDVGVGLACRVRVEKTRRCSSEGEIAADALSKGNWEEAWDCMPNKKVDPSRLPAALLKWIVNPTGDMELGNKILSDMSTYTKVLYLK